MPKPFSEMIRRNLQALSAGAGDVLLVFPLYPGDRMTEFVLDGVNTLTNIQLSIYLCDNQPDSVESAQSGFVLLPPTTYYAQQFPLFDDTGTLVGSNNHFDLRHYLFIENGPQRKYLALVANAGGVFNGLVSIRISPSPG